MNLKFIAAGVLAVAGLFFGTEKYWEHQFQEQVRSTLKGLRADQAFKQHIQNTGFPVDGDILNQYPNIITYIKLTDFTGTQAPAEIQSYINQLGCMQVEKLRNEEPDMVKAYLAVYKDDQVASTYMLQNKYGKALYQHKQVLMDCPNFASVTGIQDDAIQQAPESAAVSEETKQLNERLENGG
ncbi:hypothetical protein [Acinetobacter tianfuensis]|uniref:hypothetical protein n=1 Tax=Acinetobacter tianfuensis TaxID=2419603 RepID=UPI001D184CDB|nr:hypothetical protein [Acinetobacter tianfuensis]